MQYLLLWIAIFHIGSIALFVFWVIRIRNHDLQFQQRRVSLTTTNMSAGDPREKEIVQNITIDVEPILQMQREAAEQNAKMVVEAITDLKEFLSNLQINVVVDVPNAPDAKVTTKVTYLGGLNKSYSNVPKVTIPDSIK